MLAQLPEYPDGLSHPARFELTPNPDLLLDQCDIVLIDPVGTGWARLLDESTAKRHYSTAGDARDFSDFIWCVADGERAASTHRSTCWARAMVPSATWRWLMCCRRRWTYGASFTWARP